jgi:hypothetical protein
VIGRRLGQLGQESVDAADMLGSGATAISSLALAPSSFWNWLFPSAGTSLGTGTAQIQSVPANAAAANAAAGQQVYDVAAIQAAADEASSAFAGENQQLWDYYNPQDPSTWPWYYWAAIFGVGILLLVDAGK